jgi:hypothetical protein
MNQILKYIFRLMLCIAITVAAQSCAVHPKSKPLPPGQAKKVTGTQSAKQYAPGQQKKTTTSQSSSSKSVPPGQAKKADGNQSAKEDAPGQKKKK